MYAGIFKYWKFIPKHKHFAAALWPWRSATILIQFILKIISLETQEIVTNLYFLFLLITDSISLWDANGGVMCTRHIPSYTVMYRHMTSYDGIWWDIRVSGFQMKRYWRCKTSILNEQISKSSISKVTSRFDVEGSTFDIGVARIQMPILIQVVRIPDGDRDAI